MSTKSQHRSIVEIAKRAAGELRVDRPRLDWIMDIEAANAAVGLRLDDLLHADHFNFAHDVLGIARNLNRDTGKLENCFLPRFAALRSNAA